MLQVVVGNVKGHQIHQLSNSLRKLFNLILPQTELCQILEKKKYILFN